MSLGDRARNTLLKCGAIVADHYGYELATVGERGSGDHRFFVRMANGQNLGFKKYDEVACFLRGHWPHGVEWPSRGTFNPPEPSEVKSFMAKLPKKRLLAAPRKKPGLRGRKTRNFDSPALNASRPAKTAPAPTGLGAGELSAQQQEHQG